METQPTRWPLGMSVWFGYEMPMKERLAFIKAAGFDSTCVWWGDEEELCRTGRKHVIADMIRQSGLIFDNAHVPFQGANELWSDDAGVRRGAVDRHVRWIEEVAGQGVSLMVMHPVHGPSVPPPSESGVRSMRSIAEAGEDFGVRVAVENTSRLDHLSLIMAEVRSPDLRFCFDSSHDGLWSPPGADLLSKLGDRLLVTHVADNDGVGDTHWLPGEGVVDWRRFAAQFPADTYSGSLMLEAYRRGQDDGRSPREFLASAHQRVSWVAQMIRESEER